MPYEIQELKPARTITSETAEAAASGCRNSQKFIRAYGRSNREFLQSLAAPFSPDQFEGRSWLAQWSSEPARVLPSKAKEFIRPQRDRRLHREWENELARFGLSENQLNGSKDKQVVVIPLGDTPPLKFTDADSQLQARNGIPWQSCSSIPIQIHEREVPEWTQCDAACRDFLIHLYSNAFDGGRGAERSRVRAAKVAFVLYHFYRRLATAGEIAHDSGLEEIQVLRVAEKIRKHNFPDGEKACCRKWRKTRSDS